jgi:hypothetical protein
VKSERIGVVDCVLVLLNNEFEIITAP